MRDNLPIERPVEAPAIKAFGVTVVFTLVGPLIGLSWFTLWFSPTSLFFIAQLPKQLLLSYIFGGPPAFIVGLFYGWRTARNKTPRPGLLLALAAGIGLAGAVLASAVFADASLIAPLALVMVSASLVATLLLYLALKPFTRSRPQ